MKNNRKILNSYKLFFGIISSELAQFFFFSILINFRNNYTDFFGCNSATFN